MRKLAGWLREHITVANVAAFVSIILAIYFWRFPNVYREVSYTVSDDHIQVFDSSLLSPRIRMIDAEGNQIQENVYAASVTVWNSGNLPIDPIDVRIPLRIRIGSVSRILDYAILKQVDPDVANFNAREVTPSSDSDSISEIEISWDYFDPQFGAIIQVMYAAQAQADISLVGYILGIQRNDFRDTSKSSMVDWLPGWAVQIIILSITIGMVLLLAQAGQFFRIRLSNRSVVSRLPLSWLDKVIPAESRLLITVIFGLIIASSIFVVVNTIVQYVMGTYPPL